MTGMFSHASDPHSRSRKAATVIVLCLLLLAAVLTVPGFLRLPPASAATGAQVTVNAGTSLGTIPSTAYGVNQAAWDADLLDSSLPGLISASGATYQRYPGGSLSDGYHWQSNTTETSYANPSNTFDAFMSMAQKAGTQPIITVDYGAGTAQEAAGWVQYANKGGSGYNGPVPTYSGGSSTGHTYGIKYWEIGNEVYGDGTYGSSWEYNTHTLGPTTYADNVVSFSQAMKAVDPTIKVGLVVTTPGYWPDGVTSSTSPSPWNDTVLPIACPSVDFVIVHWYPNTGTDPAQALGTPSQIASTISAVRSKLNEYCGSRASSIQIFVTETNGGSYNPGSRATGWASAMFLDDTYMTFLENGVANIDWWEVHDDLISTGACATSGSPCDPPAETPFPPYYGLQMLSKLGVAGDTMVSSSSNQSLLAVHAVKQANGKLAVLLDNKDPNNSYTVSVGINGYSASSATTIYSYGENSTGITSSSGSGTSVTVAPYSLTTIVFSPSGSATPTPTATKTPTPTPTAGITPTPTPTKTPTPTPTAGITPTPTPTKTPTPTPTAGITPTPTPTTGVTPTPTPTKTPTPTPTAGITPTPTPTQTSGSSCKVTYTVTSQWPGGFGANLSITNTGTTTINGWTLTFTFANGQTITQLWNGSFTQSGANVTVTNVSYNGSIAPGAAVSSAPGFNASWTGTNSAPTAFSLNGVACATS